MNVTVADGWTLLFKDALIPSLTLMHVDRHLSRAIDPVSEPFLFDFFKELYNEATRD